MSSAPEAEARPHGAGWGEAAAGPIAGDIVTALAYATPAGGAVVAPITTAGVHDREAGTVTFTTSLAFNRKLERIERSNQVALAFHAREHGFAEGPAFVLVQGRATVGWTDPARQGPAILAGTVRFFGQPRSGRFWSWWMREYYMQRVPVEVAVERLTVWPRPDSAAAPQPHGLAAAAAPPSQAPPKGGTEPRLPAPAAARALRRMPHVLLGWRDEDGYPAVAPVTVAGADRDGIDLADPTGAVPTGMRRAGLVGHRYGPALTGLRVRQHTGWLESGPTGIRYAPHTRQHYRTPRGKTLTALTNGGQAKRGIRRAQRAKERAQ